MSLADLPGLPELVLDRQGPRPYTGPIEPGMVFAWEPDLPHARQLCLVTRIGPAPPPQVIHHSTGTAVLSSPEGDVIWSRAFPDDSKDECWNDVSRFREAVVPTLLKRMSV